MIIKLKSPISYQFTQKNVFLFRTQCCDNKGDLQTAFLCFRSMEHELEYQRQPDTNFHYYVFCATMLFTFLSAIQFILIPRLGQKKIKIPTDLYPSSCMVLLVTIYFKMESERERVI